MNFNIIKNTYVTLNDFININNFIIYNTTPNDYVAISTDITGIKKQSQGYYWFGVPEVVDAFNKIYPYKNKIKIEDSIYTIKPKIIILDSIHISQNLSNNLKSLLFYFLVRSF